MVTSLWVSSSSWTLTNWFGIERLRLVGKLRAQLDRSGGRIDLAVEGLQRAVGDLVGAAAIERGRRQHRAALQPLRDRLQIVLGHREQHADRLQLRDDDDAVGVARRDVVALVDLAQSDAAVERRQDVAILQVDLGGLDRGGIGFHRALILRDQRDLRVERLARHRVLRGQPLVAREIDLRALQQRLVARQIALGLRQRRLIGPRVDLGDQIAFLDLVAFLEIDLDQIAADLASDRDGRERGDGAERIEIDSDVALADGLRHDRHRRRVAAAAPLRLGCGLVLGPPDDAGDDQQQHEAGRDKAPGRSRLRRRAERIGFALRLGPRCRFLGRFDGLIHERSITEFSFIRRPLCCVAGRA